MKKSKPGLTILAKIIKTAVTLTVGKKKTRRLKRISRRRNAENLSNLPGVIRLGSDNLIIVVRLIIRLYRFHSLLAVRPRDYVIGKKNVYPKVSFPTIILIKILILASQILYSIAIGSA
jgi:hypothetical protein